MLATTLLRLFAASLCLSAPAAADGSKLGEGISLAFVFDSTGSMSDELRQVKEAMQSIFDFMRKHREKDIADFALVPFNDPGFGPATVTTNANEYRASLNAIVVDGGGDCPELSMHGIKLALEKTRPFSYLFVFTDASAKDHAMKAEVEDLIQSKKSKIVFVLTGICNNKNDPGYKAYESIAAISNGNVFNLLKNEIHKVLDFVKVDTVKKGVIASGVVPPGVLTKSIPVDSYAKKLTVTATGDKPTIDFTDPTGKHEEGKTTLNLTSAVSKEIPKPMPGNWTLNISSERPGRFVAAVESDFDFHYGFAINPTHNILETSYRPLAGAKNTLLIKITNSTNVSYLSSVVFEDPGENEFDRRKLIGIPGKTDVYIIDGMFTPPSTPFFLQVTGIDVLNRTLTRKSDSGITTQLPKPPVITLPKDTVAVKGDPLVLKCHVRSLVPFVTSWLKDSSEVQGDKHFIQSSEVPLIIEKATNSSEGIYTCRAQNSAGSSSESVKVLLEVKPVLQEPEESKIFVAPGLPKELPCTLLEGKPSPKMTWFWKGEVFRPELLSTEAKVHHNGSLIFSYFKLENEGIYECEAVNSAGKDKIELSLMGLVDPVLQEPEESEISVAPGFSKELPCIVLKGNPYPKVTWFRNGVVLEYEDLLSIGAEVHSSDSLIISYFKVENEGLYECEAENSAGKDRIKMFLKALLKPILQDPEENEISVTTGLRKELPCVVLKAHPVPNITWYRDGEVLEHEELSSVGANVHPNGSLIFSYFKLENEGLYECEAVNSVGKDRIKMSLKALVPPSIAGEDHLVMEVMLNKLAQLPCAARGNPKPRVSWTKDSAPLQDISSYGRNEGDDLFIMTANHKDNGTYQCVASNSVGEARKTIDILVRDKPKILRMNKLVNRNIGDEVLLTCKVEAFPKAEIKWLRNNVPVDSEDVEYSSNSASLRFIADTTSSGEYKCLATNVAGQDRETVEVSSGAAPYFNTSDVEKIIATVGDNVSLLCNTDGFPLPIYSWAKFPENTSKVGDSVLTLYNVQLDQEGIYSCDVVNARGSAQKLFNLKIYVPPEIKSFPEKPDPKLGGDYKLQCLADGKPKPKIKWFKDNKPLASSSDSSWLYILGANEDDAGLYTCRAENYEGIDEKHLAIQIEVPPRMKMLDFQVLEANTSTSVSLSCPPITGNPYPKVQWMRDGHPVVDSRRRTLKDQGKTLHLKRVVKHDEGIYTCVANNSHGIAEANITLEVLEPLKFLEKLSKKPIILIEGSTISLNCSVTASDPEPKVLWLRNDHLLPPDIISRLDKSKNDYILAIDSLELTDKGLYKCIVENKAGRIEHSFDLQVIMSGIEEEGRSKKGTWGEWSTWSVCSASCDHSEQVRTRKCSRTGLHCVGEAYEWRLCPVPKCKVDGGWGSWSVWSRCPVTCGSGKRIRTRNCGNPLPQNGGNLCFGTNMQSEPCNNILCPMNGGWSEWSDWRACSGPCPNGTQRRIRKCTNPAPVFGGKPCDGYGTEYRSCIQKLCPVAGGWSEWSSWTTCSATCGNSIQSRERACTNPKPEFGGDHCKGESKETRKCEIKPCDEIPTEAIIRIQGSLNGQIITDVMANISISDSSLQRLVSSSHNNIFRNEPWFPYLSIVASPVTWVTAPEQNKASNGFSLTKGVFKQTTHVKFETGEELLLNHDSYGVDSNGILQVEAHIQGSVPLFSSNVKIHPYEELYIQTAPGELYASSHTSSEGSSLSKMYSWNKKIKFDSKLGKQKYLSEVLTVHDINSRKRFHSELASIDKTDDKECPKGFFVSGEYCQDADECMDRRTHKCHQTQSCVNAVGYYTCECPSGFSSPTKGSPCEDIDECSQSPAICSSGCKNLDGSFQCLCRPGMQLLDSNTTCSSIYPVRKTPYGDELTWTECLPHQKEIDGFCQEINPCDDGEPMCAEDEMCLKIRGLYECIPFPCPPGHHRIEGTKNCIMECSDTAPCDSGAEVSEKFVPIVVSLEDPARAYKDFVNLPVEVEGETARMHTFYRILENAEGKPFRVKIQNGVGILYSKENVPAKRKFRVAVLGAVYDNHEERILHAVRFSVLIHTSYE